MNTFYVVWRFTRNEVGKLTTYGTQNPSKLHESFDTAKEEAERLARLNSNLIFSVCKVQILGEAVMNEVKWTGAK